MQKLKKKRVHDSDFVTKKNAAGRCGYGALGATINNGDVSAVSDLYRDGLGCGACYQVKRINKRNISEGNSIKS